VNHSVSVHLRNSNK